MKAIVQNQRYDQQKQDTATALDFNGVYSDCERQAPLLYRPASFEWAYAHWNMGLQLLRYGLTRNSEPCTIARIRALRTIISINAATQPYVRLSKMS